MTFDPKLTDLHILALTLYGESVALKARYAASLEEMLALGCLLRNRVVNGSTYRDECESYACWSPESEAGYSHVAPLMAQLLTGTVTDPRYIEAAWIAAGVIHGYCRDVLKGATDGHPVATLPRPEWAQGRIPALCYAKQTWYLPEGVSA